MRFEIRAAGNENVLLFFPGSWQTWKSQIVAFTDRWKSEFRSKQRKTNIETWKIRSSWRAGAQNQPIKKAKTHVLGAASGSCTEWSHVLRVKRG